MHLSKYLLFHKGIQSGKICQIFCENVKKRKGRKTTENYTVSFCLLNTPRLNTIITNIVQF